MTWDDLFAYLRRHGLNHWADQLESASSNWLVNHGDYARWSTALDALPEISSPHGVFDTAAITVAGDCADSDGLRQALQGFMPLAKGPLSDSRYLHRL